MVAIVNILYFQPRFFHGVGSEPSFRSDHSSSTERLTGAVNFPMKFLFEFVSCCVPVNMSRIENPEETEAPGVKEVRSLAPITTRKHRRRKRSASLPSAAKLAVDWKPSLGAISEDKVVLVVMEREKSDEQTAESERSVKRKSGSRDGESRGVHGRNNSNDFSIRRSPAAIPVVIPAFSPTPFLF